MLNELHIENIAVIARADVEFAPGFNVLTGETGAGKSIVIDAIDAVLGGRASRELVRRGAPRAVVNAVFTLSPEAEVWCGENDIDCTDGELILQRRLTAEGKSSCRINGMPVSAAQLRELGSMLLDIHGQNDGRQLMDESRHRGYLDGFGVPPETLEEYRALYHAWRETKKEIDRLSLDEIEKQRLEDSLRYQIDELTKAGLRAGEEEELSARRDLLRNGEKLTEAAEAAYAALYGGEDSAVELAGAAEGALQRVSSVSQELAQACGIIRDAVCALEDAAERIRDFRESLDFSPQEYDNLESRLALLRRLEKKYGLDEAGLIEHLDGCVKKLDELEYAGDMLIKLNKELEKRENAVLSGGEKLSLARKAAAEKLEKRITEQLRDLSMPSVRFEVEISPVTAGPGFDSHGRDEVRFLMSANARQEPGRISKIASGGELSRIMLAMKSVFAENDSVPTMIFDEIDTGVSGIAAQRVGEKMAALSGGKQVLCVTHLPQIAALADTHFVIEKTEEDRATFTRVLPLTRDGRVRELARLHGGDNITDKTLASAGEQLDAAVIFKNGLRNGGESK